MAMQSTAERARIESDFATQQISICGKTFIADLSGALFWPAEDALIFGDLHLEKGSAMASRGALVPPYDTRATLRRLSEIIDSYQPSRVIALGDSLHDPGAAERLPQNELHQIRMLQHGRHWYWITGNHDPHIPEALGGIVIEVLMLGGLTFRHEPASRQATHEIAGHLHPAAKIKINGYTMRRSCFVSNGRRLVVPAFGAYTGGLNVLDEAFAPLFPGDALHVWMLGQEGVYPVAATQLRAD